jgi:hypothetical protein
VDAAANTGSAPVGTPRSSVILMQARSSMTVIRM